MSQQDIHIHLHPGVDPETARAAVEAARGVSATEVIHPENGQPPKQPDEAKVLEYAERAYSDSYADAKPLLEFLADNPDRPIPYTEISEALGYKTSRSLPGLLGAFGRRAKHRYEGIKPFEATMIDGAWHLRMRPDVAEVINKAR